MATGPSKHSEEIGDRDLGANYFDVVCMVLHDFTAAQVMCRSVARGINQADRSISTG